MKIDAGAPQQLVAVSSPPVLKSATGDVSGRKELQLGDAATGNAGKTGASGETPFQVGFKKSEQSTDKIHKKAEKPEGLARFMNRSLKLELDQDSGVIIAKIVDKDSGEVIKQVPPEQLIKLAQELKSEDGKANNGLFVNQEV